MSVVQSSKRGTMTTPAPVFNKMVISPQAPPQAPPQTLGASTERDRVVAAVRLGAALEELVVRCRLQDLPDPSRERYTADRRFPLDLSSRRSATALLEVTLRKLLDSEKIVFERQRIGAGATAPTAASGNSGSQPIEGAGPTSSPPSGPPSGPASEPPSPLPSQGLEIRQKIQALLDACGRDDNPGNVYLHLSGPDGLDEKIREWDSIVIDRIVDDPVVMSGYSVGKALSYTRWQIWAAQYPGPEGGDRSSDPWDRAFGAERIAEIQRHVNAVGTVLDPRAATTVATGLGYWRNTLLRLPWIMDPSKEAAVPGPGRTISVPTDQSDKLAAALEEQLDNWLDLLTGRRQPESFPVAGIVTTLTKNLTEGMAASFWARAFRFAVPFFVVVAVVAIVVAVLLAAATAVGSLLSGGESNPTGGLLGSLGTALSGVLAFLAVRGRTLFNRGADAISQLQGRTDALEGQLDGTSGQAATALGSQRVSWQGLGEDVFSNVVNQIRLEELNLAVSAPLMRFVLALNDRASNDPLEDAQRFLRLAYGNRSNLDRLEPIFKEFYKHFRAAPPG